MVITITDWLTDSQPTARPGLRGGLVLAAGLVLTGAAAYFVLNRQLNFDESLALRAGDLEAMVRALNAELCPGERVLDPSGLAWFAAPCTRQWYSDRLFEPAVRAHRWMGELELASARERCDWWVNTDRAVRLPWAARQEWPGR